MGMALIQLVGCGQDMSSPLGDPLYADVKTFELQGICYPGDDGDGHDCVKAPPERLTGDDPAYLYPDPAESGDPETYAAPTHFLDLEHTSLDFQVSPDFVLDPFINGEWGRWALIQPVAVERLQAMQAATGVDITVTSAFRNVEHNRDVGGAERSRHLYGDALDLWSELLSLDELADECDAEGASYVEVSTSHVHCDWRYEPDSSFFASSVPM